MYKTFSLSQFYNDEEQGFYWYLEKWTGYENRRAIYEEIASFYTHSDSGWDREVNMNEYNNFKEKLKVCLRDTKLKKLQGYFKHDKYHYAKLHLKNK